MTLGGTFQKAQNMYRAGIYKFRAPFPTVGTVRNVVSGVL
jgi:hypothetical protein